MAKPEWYVPVSVAADMLECDWKVIHNLTANGHISYIRMPRGGIRLSVESLCRLRQASGQNAVGANMRLDNVS
ncbi:MAG: hypothetical protein P4L55_16050 [Syntrophobacteraceae bacterium]|nr:hypothetical protein [Syntrophobacteraceae bacterium]